MYGAKNKQHQLLNEYFECKFHVTGVKQLLPQCENSWKRKEFKMLANSVISIHCQLTRLNPEEYNWVKKYLMQYGLYILFEFVIDYPITWGSFWPLQESGSFAHVVSIS